MSALAVDALPPRQRSDSLQSAHFAKMCMPQHRSVWVLCLSSLRLTLMSPPAQFPLPPPKNTCRHPPPNLPHWEAVMRGEVLGVERRRRWSDEDKLSILSSIGIDGATVTQVAYRCDVTRQQIYRWRHELKKKGLWPPGKRSSSGMAGIGFGWGDSSSATWQSMGR